MIDKNDDMKFFYSNIFIIIIFILIILARPLASFVLVSVTIRRQPDQSSADAAPLAARAEPDQPANTHR